MPREERPALIEELIDMVKQASESVNPFAIWFARKVASKEAKGKIEVELLPNQIVPLEGGEKVDE